MAMLNNKRVKYHVALLQCQKTIGGWLESNPFISIKIMILGMVMASLVYSIGFNTWGVPKMVVLQKSSISD